MIITHKPDVTISTGIYAAGDSLGGKITITPVHAKGTITGIVLADHDTESDETDVVFFDSDPSSSTFTDNAAISIHDDDSAKVIGIVNVGSSDYVDLDASTVATKYDLGIDYQLTGDSMYVALVARATPTYSATTDIELSIITRGYMT